MGKPCTRMWRILGAVPRAGAARPPATASSRVSISTVPRAGAARPAAVLLTALLPLVGGCAVLGYPSPFLPPASAATSASGTGERAPLPAAGPGPTATAGSYVVFGERYYVLGSAEGYREMGLASWYGDEFAGRPTATGEIYDPGALTAAHRSLPLSTWVEVTNLENGHVVVLRVNDRGPFADTHLRIIDVSHEAARLLGFADLGLARVEVRALPAEGGRSLPGGSPREPRPPPRSGP